MEGTLKNEIAIDCKGFSEDKKKKAQEALFTLGYEWLGFGKKFMYKQSRILVGRTIDCDQYKGKILMWSKVPDLEFESSMVTFDELMGMAGMKKEESMKVDNIAIDCTNFDEDDKKYAQEVFFNLGYKWGTPGYQHLECHGYCIDNGKLSIFIHPVDEGTKQDFPHLKFLTLSELTNLAGQQKRKNTTNQNRSNQTPQ